MIDKTIVQIVSIVIASTGLFAALSRYHSREARQAFWGDSPFILKKEMIDGVLSLCYASWTLVGFIIQWILVIFNPNMPIRIYRLLDYILLSVTIVVCSIIVIKILSRIGYWIARPKWKYDAIKQMRANYLNAKYIVEHDGWREDQYDQREHISNAQDVININYKEAKETIERQLKLYDIKVVSLDLYEQIEKLGKIYS